MSRRRISKDYDADLTGLPEIANSAAMVGLLRDAGESVASSARAQAAHLDGVAGGPGRFSDSIRVEETSVVIGYGGESRPAIRVYSDHPAWARMERKFNVMGNAAGSAGIA